jgi:Flp pilus assembly protein TadG
LFRGLFSKERQRGQSLVEMTVGTLVLAVIISGLLDLGRLYYVYVALEDGAGEGALYMAIDPECWTTADGADCADPNNGLYRVANAGSGQVDWSSAVVTFSYNDLVAPTGEVSLGDTVIVTIQYDFPLITPLIPEIAGVNPIPLTVSASQTVIREP